MCSVCIFFSSILIVLPFPGPFSSLMVSVGQKAEKKSKVTSAAVGNSVFSCVFILKEPSCVLQINVKSCQTKLSFA